MLLYVSPLYVSNAVTHVGIGALGLIESQFAYVLQGDLSLLADKGQAGLPLGHIIAYKADHELHIEFARKLKASCGPADVVASEKA